MVTWDVVVALVVLAISLVIGEWAMLRLLLEVSNSFKWYDDEDGE